MRSITAACHCVINDHKRANTWFSDDFTIIINCARNDKIRSWYCAYQNVNIWLFMTELCERTEVSILIVTATGVIIVLKIFCACFNMNLDNGSSKIIQDIIITPKERLYMGKSGEYQEFWSKTVKSGQS